MHSRGPCATLSAMLDEAPRPSLPAVAVIAADRRVRDSLASLLAASGEVRLVGAAGDVAGALRLVDGEEPDVAVVDRDLANGQSQGTLLPLLRLHAPAMRLLVIDWDRPAGTPPFAGADDVLDLGEGPSALLDTILGRGQVATKPDGPPASD